MLRACLLISVSKLDENILTKPKTGLFDSTRAVPAESRADDESSEADTDDEDDLSVDGVPQRFTDLPEISLEAVLPHLQKSDEESQQSSDEEDLENFVHHVAE